MKRSPLRKTSKRRSPLKTLQNKAEKLWRECVLHRDGHRCMVKHFYPHLNIPHSHILQGDHCFSRVNKHLFLELHNGTTVCSTCNMYKAMDRMSLPRVIDDIVKTREGEERFNEMRAIDQMLSSSEMWKNFNYLEQKIKDFEALLEGFKKTSPREAHTAGCI